MVKRSSMIQTQIEFTTASPINQEKFKGQVKTIFQHLDTGRTITVFDAIRLYNIYHLHSRISDLRNKCGVIVYDKMVSQNGTNCKEYSLTPFNKKNCE